MLTPIAAEAMLGEPSRLADFMAFATDPVSRKAIAMAAAAQGIVQPAIHDGGIELAQTMLADAPAGLALVVDLSDAKAPLPAMDALADAAPEGTRVVAIGTVNDVGLYRGLRGLGIADYVLKPLDPDELGAALGRMLAVETPAGGPPYGAQPLVRARSVGLIGARGGAGATTIAVALAARAAAGGGRRVGLVDLDFQWGSMGLDCEVEPSPGLAQLVDHPDRLDATAVAAALRPHRLGMKLVHLEEPMERPLEFRLDTAQALLAAALPQVDALVLDLPRLLDRAHRAVLRTLDAMVVVAPPTLAGLRDTRRLVQLLAGLRAGQQPLVVVNGAGGRPSDLSRSDFERGLGQAVAAWIPWAPKAAARALERAGALAENSPASPEGRALAVLAAAAGLTEAADASARPWWRRWADA